MVWIIVLALFLSLDLMIFVLIYNKLVKRRNQVREGWSGIEVQLKRRHDLIPQLVSSVSAYAAHEKEVFEEVATVRANAQKADGAEDSRQAEEELAGKMGKVMILVEDYPDLKADQNFQELIKELVNTEDELQYARRYYNGSVRDLNNAVESFPSNVIASFFKFQQSPYYEVSSAAERIAPTAFFDS